MLPAEHRLTDADGFRHASRQGARAGCRTLVAHLVGGPADTASAAAAGVSVAPVSVGFVVSKAVGNAVVRNRVRRRLRHAMRERVASLPAAATLVVRAQPAAAAASYQELARDLDRCLQRVMG